MMRHNGTWAVVPVVRSTRRRVGLRRRRLCGTAAVVWMPWLQLWTGSGGKIIYSDHCRAGDALPSGVCAMCGREKRVVSRDGLVRRVPQTVTTRTIRGGGV